MIDKRLIQFELFSESVDMYLRTIYIWRGFVAKMEESKRLRNLRNALARQVENVVKVLIVFLCN